MVLARDLQYGFNSERMVLNKLNADWRGFSKTKEMYNHFDFRDDERKIDVELKTRRNTKTKYNTVFFSKLKLDAGRERMKNGETNRVIYLFCYDKDETGSGAKKLWYWEDFGDNDDDFSFIFSGNYNNKELTKPLVSLDCNKLKKYKYLAV